MVTSSQVVSTEELAGRIERAYLRRHPRWSAGCTTSRVWEAAASTLMRVHLADRSIPADPELYVATQPIGGRWADPWSELTRTKSARRYRSQIRRIVAKLRGELRREIRRAEARVVAGLAIESILLPSNSRLTALGGFIVASRAGRPDLTLRLEGSAAEQHRSCPLYRQAALAFLSDELYPEPPAASGLSIPTRPGRDVFHICMN